jgi:hypothetical protein
MYLYRIFFFIEAVFIYFCFSKAFSILPFAVWAEESFPLPAPMNSPDLCFVAT